MTELALISTYPPFECGIAVYTKHLAEAIAAIPGWSCCVVSEGGMAAPAVHVSDSYSRQGDYHTAILRALDALTPAVAHFQHAPDLFPDNDRFADLLDDVSRRGIRVFVTLHTVYDQARWHTFHRRLARSAGVIVHNQSCRDILTRNLPLDATVAVIPHGTRPVALPDRAESRRALGIPEDRFVFLFFGWVHAQKNLHTVVLAFKKLLRTEDRATLVVAGRPGGDRFYNHLYMKACRLFSGQESRHLWRAGFVAESDIDRYFGAADVLLLPYWQRYYSASGVFHMAMGSGKPVLCSTSPKFDELGDAAAELPIFIPTHSIGRWADAMRQMISDDALRTRVSNALSDYGRQTAWARVARMHADLFTRG